MYRAGLVTSDSDSSQIDVTQKLALQGYPAKLPNPGEPAFRQVPNRWVIWRTIHCHDVGPYQEKIMVTSNTYEEAEIPDTQTDYVPGDASLIHDAFIIEGVSLNGLLFRKRILMPHRTTSDVLKMGSK